MGSSQATPEQTNHSATRVLGRAKAVEGSILTSLANGYGTQGFFPAVPYTRAEARLLVCSPQATEEGLFSTDEVSQQQGDCSVDEPQAGLEREGMPPKHDASQRAPSETKRMGHLWLPGGATGTLGRERDRHQPAT